MRYLTSAIPCPPAIKAILNDIGTEELAHLEIVATLVYNLIKMPQSNRLRLLGWMVIMLIMIKPFIS